MKRILLTSALFLFLFYGLNAQNMPTVQDRVNRLKEKLSLTDQQTAKVDSILSSSMEKMQSIPDTVQDRRNVRRQIMTEVNQQIQSILTDKQKEEYKKMMEERRSNMRRRWQRNNNN